MIAGRLLAAAMIPGLALLASCGPSGGGQSPSSAPPAASSAPPAAPAAASDTAPPSGPSSEPAVGPAPVPPPRSAPAMAPRKQPTAAQLLRDDPGYAARERKLDALYENAKERDPTGEVERQQASALAQRRACVDKACLDAWFNRREAALRTYVEN